MSRFAQHRSEEVRRKIDETIITNFKKPPYLRKTHKAIGDELGESFRYIQARVRLLRSNGQIAPIGGRSLRQYGAPNAENAKPVSQALDAEKALADIEAGIYTDTNKRRRVLETIIAVGADNHKIRAIEVLEDIDRRKERTIGRRPPTTRESRIDRLSRLNLASGKEDATLAFERAFTPQTPSQDHGIPAPSGDPLGGRSG